MVYYGILLAVDQLGGNLYMNFIILSLIDIPSNCLQAWSLQRFGRKATILPCMFIAGVACLSVAFTPSHASYDIMRTVLGIVGKFFIVFPFIGIFTWTSELYRTSLRSTAVGMFQLTMHVGAASAPFIAQGLCYVSPKAPYVLMGLMALLAACTGMYIPKTRNAVMDSD